MHAIELYDGPTFSSKRTLVEVLSLPPQGCNLGEMRKRIKIMDAIEAAEG